MWGGCGGGCGGDVGGWGIDAGGQGTYHRDMYQIRFTIRERRALVWLLALWCGGLFGEWPGLGMLSGLTDSVAWAQEEYRLDGGQWTRQTEFDPATPEGQLQAIRKAIAEDRAGRAKKLADRWIKSNPRHPQLVEAYLLRGDALVLMGKYYHSLFDYEYVIRTYPGTEQFNSAIEREYELARRFTGLDTNGQMLKRKFLGLRWIPTDGEGEEIFIRTQERAPGSEIGERASLSLADYYFQQSEMVTAAEAYDLFLTNYPESRHRERAMLRLIQANLATFKGPRFDTTGLIEAQQRLLTFEAEYPASAERIGSDALRVRIRESVARKSYEIGRWYEQRSEPFSAVYMYQRVVQQFPQTAAAQASLERLGKLDPARYADAIGAKRPSGSAGLPGDEL